MQTLFQIVYIILLICFFSGALLDGKSRASLDSLRYSHAGFFAMTEMERE